MSTCATEDATSREPGAPGPSAADGIAGAVTALILTAALQVVAERSEARAGGAGDGHGRDRPG